jgi:O-antigen ligase
MGFLAGIGAYLILARRLMNASRTIGGLGFVLLSIPIIAVGLAVLVPGELVDERITNPDNVLGRFATWIATLQLLNTGPIFGVGLNNLHGLLARAVTKYGTFGSYSTPHNSLLSILVELGIVGFVAYSAIIVTIIKTGLRLCRRSDYSKKDKWRGIGLVGIMVAYFTPSMFANTMYVPGLIHFYVYLFAGAVAGLYSTGRASVAVYSNRQADAMPRVANRSLPNLAR